MLRDWGSALWSDLNLVVSSWGAAGCGSNNWLSGSQRLIIPITQRPFAQLTQCAERARVIGKRARRPIALAQPKKKRKESTKHKRSLWSHLPATLGGGLAECWGRGGGMGWAFKQRGLWERRDEKTERREKRDECVLFSGVCLSACLNVNPWPSLGLTLLQLSLPTFAHYGEKYWDFMIIGTAGEREEKGWNQVLIVRPHKGIKGMKYILWIKINIFNFSRQAFS